ncbi:MAG: hypothetical protein E7344_01115 [Clostridiales bacterium]|nr:hypothetical protein [Clostridiales bacterium]
MDEKKSIIQKIKSIKNIEVIIAFVLAAIVLVVFFNDFGQKVTKQTNISTTFSSYVADLENKIKSVISKIDGAGECDVVISFVGGVEQEYAFSNESQQNGEIITNKTTLTLVSGKPVLIREKMPEIQGVVIVADGAGKTAVKLEITKAVQALLKVPNGNIEVFKRS